MEARGSGDADSPRRRLERDRAAEGGSRKGRPARLLAHEAPYEAQRGRGLAPVAESPELPTGVRPRGKLSPGRRGAGLSPPTLDGAALRSQGRFGSGLGILTYSRG